MHRRNQAGVSKSLACLLYTSVLRGDAELLGEQRAGLLGYLDAVGVAGVGVAAVADDRAGLAVGEVLFGDLQRRALDEVRRVDRGGGGGDASSEEKTELVVMDSEWYGVDGFQLDSSAGGQAWVGAPLFEWDAENSKVVDNICQDWTCLLYTSRCV